MVIYWQVRTRFKVYKCKIVLCPLGVRFKEIGSHLNFEIYVTKFDFDTGKLKPEHSKWKDNPNTDVAAKNPR